MNARDIAFAPIAHHHWRMDIAAILDAAMRDRKMSQTSLSKLSGVPQATISRTLKGKTIPETATIHKLYDALGIRYTIDHAEEGLPRVVVSHQSITIPRLSCIASMGDGVDLSGEDAVIDRLTLKRDWLQENLPGIHFAGLAIISGKGDSMSPTFSDGDLLLIDTTKKNVDIDGVYVLSAHNRLFIKSVRQRIDGSYEISSDNPKVKTVDILNGNHEVTVHGRVVWAWNGKRL